jgi:hypothetical protein
MMSGSKKFSKKINYDNIDVLFPESYSMKTAESDYGMDEDEKSDEDKADDTDKQGLDFRAEGPTLMYLCHHP